MPGRSTAHIGYPHLGYPLRFVLRLGLILSFTRQYRYINGKFTPHFSFVDCNYRDRRILLLNAFIIIAQIDGYEDDVYALHKCKL